MRLDENLRAWGYPISIRETETERPVEERKERRKVLAEVLKALTGVQQAPAGERVRRVLSRGAQHSELLRWVVVYNERIRGLIRDEPEREVAVRDGDAQAKVFRVAFGEERQLTGAHWRFYFVAALMSTLEAANYKRALGQSQYLRLDPSSLRSVDELKGIDATLVQSEKCWLLKLSRHDRKLEPGILEERLRAMDHQRAQLTYKNRLCVTVHKGNMYRIINVTDKTTDTEQFEKQGVRVTVAQYFRDTYNIDVQGKRLVEAKEVRGASRVCLLPANLLRIVAQAPPPSGRSQRMARPKTAQETLSDCVSIVDEILRTREVQDQMSELKVQIGDNGLPLNVRQYVTDLKKLMGDVRSYGEPRIQWGSLELSDRRDTTAYLSTDFGRSFRNNLALRHKVPLDRRWQLVICTGRRQHTGGTPSDLVNHVIERTREKVRFRNVTAVEMQMVEPDALEEFFKDEDAWTTGKVERTKRQLADVFNRRDKENCRGSLVLLAYDSDDVNNRVRVAAKQVSLQLDYPIQCCKFQTLYQFRTMPSGDKSMNVWWNVYVQFQTKIIDESNEAGVPWVAEDPLAPVSENDLEAAEVVRAIGVAVNSFGPPNSRCGVVGIVGCRNVEHTRFVSHIGASAPEYYRAGVIKDMERHFMIFWKKFSKHLERVDAKGEEHIVPPAHLIIYRSAASGSSQTKEILAQELAAMKRVLESELGRFEFNSETRELRLEHQMAAAFPEASFTLQLSTCAAVAAAQFQQKMEESGSTISLNTAELGCQGATVNSEGRHIISFKLEEGTVPYLRRRCRLDCTYEFPEPEAFKVYGVEGEDTKQIVLPESHPILEYARSNSPWATTIKLDFTAAGKEAESKPVFGLLPAQEDASPHVSLFDCDWTPGITVHMKKITIQQVVQRVHLNVLINPHRPASPMRFFMMGRDNVQGLALGSYIDSGPIIPVASDTAEAEKKFLLGTADPTRGSPSASEFQIAANGSDWSTHYFAVVSYKLCHMYYNWPGTVKHPNLLQMALAIVRQHQIYVASESGYGLDSEFSASEPPEDQPPPSHESPEEGEEPEAQERVQKRRQEVGYIARFAGGEGRGAPDDAAEKEAGRMNLKELKASLENVNSVLMTTAFML